MTSSVRPSVLGSDIDPAVAELIEDLVTRLQAGEAVDVAAVIAAHPQHADQLRRLLPAVEALAQLGRSASAEDAAPPPVRTDGEQATGTLGDFRLIRQVGRGGMGIVYEAEQVSLGRRVALKVLPFAATMDPRHLQRFHNEARAAAGLHHTNIVPVYAVGEERAVHFYAMQFIEGQTLAAIIADLRRRAGSAPLPEAQSTTPAVPAAPAAETAARAAASTERSPRDAAYFRQVAEWGIQAAEALDHAHTLGIIHRDVKPANLMVDAAGRLWVTDFGLAQVQSDTRLTMTGDLVGTLRYMSPEQALAKRVVVDHRTDVYSLGATLYELLALQPAFEGSDRQELLRQIAFEEPRRLRRINKAIPAELETIVHKALEKNPQDRYATARELADDLERFVKDEPIRAKRPGLLARGRKWARRHRPIVWAAAVVLLLAGVFGGSSGLWWLQKRAGAEGEARAAVREAVQLQQEEKWAEALSAVRRAEGVLAGFGADPELRRQVEQLGKDLEMARRLEEARLQGAAVKDGHFDEQARMAAYVEAFQWYGLDLDNLNPLEAGERMHLCSIRMQMAAALDDWAGVRKGNNVSGWKHLVVIARVADPDPWRNRLRDTLENEREKRDPRALEELAASARGDELAPATAVLLAEIARGTPAAKPTLKVLQELQQRHPADFWVSHTLGYGLHELQPPHLEEAIRYLTAAVALRPQSPGAHVNLARALHDKAQMDEAIAEYREAIRLKKDHAGAHRNLGNALDKNGQLDEAIAEHQEAIRLNKDDADAHLSLGIALYDKKDVNGAIQEYRKAIDLDPKHAFAHNNLGNALLQKGRLDEAIAEYQEALRLKKDDAEAHNGLGVALLHKGQIDDAIAEFREAIRLKKDFAEVHNNLGHALRDKGQFAEALTFLRRGHELGSKNPRWAYPSAQWVKECERLVELDAKLPKVLKGEVQPADVSESLAMAQICQLHKSLYAAAVHFYTDAFAAQPQLADDLRLQHRYNAACAAAMAGSGLGKDSDKLDAKERARLRKQALDWLGADLKAYRQVMDKSADKAGPEIAPRMQRWQQDTDFAGVRGPEALGKLPEAERQPWQKLWSDVADTLAKAKSKPILETKPNAK